MVEKMASFTNGWTSVQSHKMSEAIFFHEIEWEWMIFTVFESEEMMSKVHEWEETILQFAYFQDVMRNDWKLTEIKWENIILDS